MFSKLSEIGIQTTSKSSWMSRMGLAGFSFFFIKGILWLLTPLLGHLALFN